MLPLDDMVLSKVIIGVIEWDTEGVFVDVEDEEIDTLPETEAEELMLPEELEL